MVCIYFSLVATNKQVSPQNDAADVLPTINDYKAEKVEEPIMDKKMKEQLLSEYFNKKRELSSRRSNM